MAVAGLYRGQVFFYQTDGMKYYTQVECRNRKGALKAGKKVTGLCFHNAKTTYPNPANINGEGKGGDHNNNSDTSNYYSSIVEQLLISTNDSRLRLYQTDDYSMIWKYKGLKNDQMQIKATVSSDGRYIISGSENGNIYIWNLDPTVKILETDTEEKKLKEDEDEDKAILGLFASNNDSKSKGGKTSSSSPSDSIESPSVNSSSVGGGYGVNFSKFNLNYNLPGYKKDRNTSYEWFNAQQIYQDSHLHETQGNNSNNTNSNNNNTNEENSSSESANTNSNNNKRDEDDNEANPPIIPVALFVPSSALNYACKGTIFEPFLGEKGSGLNKNNNNNSKNTKSGKENGGINETESKMIITSDYNGKIKVYMRHALVRKFL